MGAIRDIINTVDQSATVSTEIKENLDILMKLAESKAKNFEDDIILDLRTGKTTDSLTVPITMIARKEIEYRAITKSTTSDVIEEIGKSISGMINDPSASVIVGGIANIAGAALKTIMGTGEGTEQVARQYAVIADYPAIVRFDFAFWVRKIQAKSIKEHVETAMACVVYKSAVDVSKLAFNDFLTVYGQVLLSGFGSDKSEMKKMIQDSREIYILCRDNQGTLQNSSGNTEVRLNAAQKKEAEMDEAEMNEALEIVKAAVPGKIIYSDSVPGDFEKGIL